LREGFRARARGTAGWAAALSMNRNWERRHGDQFMAPMRDFRIEESPQKRIHLRFSIALF
jgi:hypothetical protein